MTAAQIAAVNASAVAGQLAASQIADGAINTAKFASGLEPVGIVSSVPGTKSTSTVFNTTDGKLYRWTGSAYVATVPAADISGQVQAAQIAGLAASQITGTLTAAQIAAVNASAVTGTLVASQIADASLTAAKFASGLEPVGVVTSVPSSKSTSVIYNSTDGKTYRWNGSAYVASVAAGDITGTLAAAQIASLAASQITGTLTSTQIASITAAQLTGSITSTQITDGAISTAKLAAGAVTASTIAANTITAGQIAANAITAATLAAGAVTTAKLAAGAVTANELAALAVTAGKVDANAITATEIAANAITSGKIQAGAVGATQIAAGSISAKHLLIADLENLCLNPGGEQGTDGWDGIVTGPNTAIGGLPSTVKSLRTINRDAYYGQWFPVTPGDQFLLSADLYPAQAGDNPPTANAAPMMQIAEDTSGTNSQWYQTAYADRTSATWQTVSGTITVTAAKRYGRLAMQINGTWGATGSWHFRNFRAQRKNTGSLIVDGTITGTKIAATTITAANIAANTITAGQIAGNTITATQIASGTITSAQIAAGTIQASNIAAGTITGDRLQANTITATQLAANSVTAAAIQAGAITATELAAGAVTTSRLAAGAVTANEIAASTITGSRVAAGTITGTNIAATTITAGNIAAGTITATQVAAGTITGANIAAGTVQASNIAAATITGDRIAANTIQTGNIAANAITAGTIAAGAVGASQIAAGAITTDKLFVTGRGAALNADPMMTDQTAWTNGTVASGLLSSTPGASNDTRTRDLIRLDPTKAYRLEITLRQDFATAGTAYLGVIWHDANGNALNSNASPIAGTTTGWTNGTFSYFGLFGTAAPTIDTTYSVAFGAGETRNIPPAAVGMKVVMLLNYNSTASAVMRVSKVWLCQKADADLIVDGSIIAGKLGVDAVTANNIAANSIAASKLILSDFTNIYPDFDCDDVGFYTPTNGVLTFTATTSAGLGRKYVSLSADTEYGSGGLVQSAWFPVEVSAELLVKGAAWLSTADASTSATLGIEFGSLNGTAVTTTRMVQLGSNSAAYASPASHYTAEITTGSTERRARFVLTRGAGGSAGARMGGLRVQRRANASLIVDGSIVAGKIATDAVTAGTVAAGAISAREIAAAAITTDKLLVTGRGRAINDDPGCQDASAWTNYSGAGTFVSATVTDGSIGNSVLRLTGMKAVASKAVPVVPGQRYKVTALLRKTTAGTGTTYLRLECKDNAGASTSYMVTAQAPVTTGTLEGRTLTSSTWERWTGYITPSAGSVTARLCLYANWASGSAGVTEVQDLRAEEYIGADLIVDGAILANHLSAGSIAVGTAAIENGAISNAMIASAAIDNAKIANATIQGAKIANATITDANIASATITSAKIAALDAAKITTGTLDANRIGAGTITASHINGQNLTIYSGSYTSSWAWPASGGGFHLSSTGLLFGDYSLGRYFQITSGGNISAPGFTITNGAASFNGTVTANSSSTLPWAAVSGAGTPADNATADLSFTVSAGITVSGNSLSKTGGSNVAWDHGAYSRQSYAGGAYVTAVVAQANCSIIFGLNTDPATDQNWTSIDYGIYAASDGNLYIRNSGSATSGALTTYVAGDSLTVSYDGANVRYYKNNTLIYGPLAATVSAALYFDSSFYTVGGQITGVRFGPLSNVANGEAAYSAVNDSSTGLATKLASNARNVLTTGASQVGIVAGSLTWNPSTGARVSGNGVAMTPNGLVGYKSDGTSSFSIGTDGSASFAGTLSAASGTFSGTLTADAVNAVSTINIGSEQVTVPRANYTAASQTLSSSTVTVQSVSIPAHGGKVVVDFGCNLYVKPSGSGTTTVSYAVYRGATSIASASFDLVVETSMTFRVPPVVDQPSAGTYTYSVQMTVTSATSATASVRGMTAIEMQR
jgi:hypothetical protein